MISLSQTQMPYLDHPRNDNKSAKVKGDIMKAAKTLGCIDYLFAVIKTLESHDALIVMEHLATRQQETIEHFTERK